VAINHFEILFDFFSSLLVAGETLFSLHYIRPRRKNYHFPAQLLTVAEMGVPILVAVMGTWWAHNFVKGVRTRVSSSFPSTPLFSLSLSSTHTYHLPSLPAYPAWMSQALYFFCASSGGRLPFICAIPNTNKPCIHLVLSFLSHAMPWTNLPVLQL
jgi:hypothetical protein